MGGFAAVAGLAGEGEVVVVVGAAPDSGDDVVDVEVCCVHGFLAEVAAAAVSLDEGHDGLVAWDCVAELGAWVLCLLLELALEFLGSAGAFGCAWEGGYW